MAALEHGLNPEYSINDPGVIWMGKKSYGDAVWNKSRSNHGITNLYNYITKSIKKAMYIIAKISIPVFVKISQKGVSRE